jgi:hypothetical protein
MPFNSKFWLRFSVINLLIVALLGLLMRYKIGFEFPFFNQKNILHSHSHFAFSGWISHTLILLMVLFLEKTTTQKRETFSENYNLILMANLICAYGMLISFIIEGYGAISIFFSTMSIIVSYAFGYRFWNDLKFVEKENLSINWFKGAIFFNVLSSIGTFFLAYMMATKNILQNEYLASIYYYLHFQYNGWFFFACMGLLFYFFNLKTTENSFYNKVFWWFFVTCIPAYFLSTLWLKLPSWLYFLIIIAAFVQVYGWFRLLFVLYREKQISLKNYPLFLRYILLFIGIALTIKLLLQLGSVIPALSQLAFGFRPIVIAYLHLVLLAIISLFLLFYIFGKHLLFISKGAKNGLILFSIGVFLNELFLAIQGMASFSYTLIPKINELLFVAALVMVSGLSIMIFHILKKVKISPLL